MIFAFFVGGLFASYFTGNVVGIIVFGIPFIVIVFPFSLIVASLFPDAASVAVSVPFVFAYLYLLSCLISYGLRRRKHLNRVVTWQHQHNLRARRARNTPAKMANIKIEGRNKWIAVKTFQYPPSPWSACHLLTRLSELADMTSVELQDKPAEVVPYEIECPRCYGWMSLCFDDDTPFYACDNCDFILHVEPKKSQWTQLHMCKSVCVRVGVKGSNHSLYKLGMMYCPKCEVYYRSGATHCFCCGCTLRYKSRAKKNRKTSS